MAEIATPGVHTISDLSAFLAVGANQTVKSLIVSAENDDGAIQLFGLMLRGDHELNEVKAQRILGISG